jgi:putative N-acetylmannosamine-6-phosphate epimerase
LFELLERYETEDNVYVAITEYRDDEEEIVEADFEVIILKVVNDENGDEFLEEIQDEMEYEQVSDILMAKVEEKFDVEYFEPEQ